MSTFANRSLRAGVVAIAPALLLAALSYHPYLPGRQPNIEALAAAVAAGPTRWGVAHLATGLASGVLALAFLAIRSHLRAAGENRWSAPALPLVVIGSTLYAMLPAMEFAPLAANEAGGDIAAAQIAILPWFIPILVAGGITFAASMFGFAVGVSRSGVLSPWPARLVAAALVVMALSRVVPLSTIQFHLQGVAGFVALLPLAYSMRNYPATPVLAQHRTRHAT
ncbi:hypothetical protein [Actinokineospora sp.]|uniref:hypothetical protein n=1 Tax=Actinokineospora sp. TaxID=1872133 RepID=UPI003D6B7747